MAPFLARDAEVGTLEGAVGDARAGRGRLFLLVGEAGIGKTRLADELCSRTPKDVRVLWGRCWEAGGAPAYWPWIEILRPLIAEADPATLAKELGAAAGSLAALMPELRDRLPDLPSGEAGEAGDSDRDRFLLFDALARFLRATSSRTPLLLVLDDLHVADRPSLRLLEFVARALRGMRMLVIGTYRDAEARLLPGIEPLLVQIEREGERLQLRRLSEIEIASFIESVVCVPPDPRTVAAVLRATDGTPLYVSEVVRLMLAQGAPAAPGATVPVPDGLQPAIRGHLARVSDEARAILRLAAVVGREFDHEVLGVIAESEGMSFARDLSHHLAEAQRAGLIAELPHRSGRYRFNHILIRETIYRDLGAVERARLHGQVARVFEADAAAGRPEGFAELAHHCLRAPIGPERRKGAVYARRAGEHALATTAYEEAVEHFRSALAVLDDAGPGVDRERAELLLALAHAHQRCGDRAASLEAVLQTVDLARALGDPVILARAALRLGAEFSFGRVDPTLVGLLEEALSILPSTSAALRARLMARLAAARQPAANPDEPLALAREAMALAREIGDRETLAAVLRDGRTAYLPMDDLDERIALDLETLALANETGDRLTALHTQHRLATDRLESGQIAATLAHLDQFDLLAEERREPHRLWWSKYERASIHTLLGRFAEAERLLGEADASVAHTQEPLARMARVGHWATFAGTTTRPFDFAPLGRELSAAIAAIKSPALFFWELVFHCRSGDVAYVRAACAREPLDRLPARLSGSDVMAEMARLIEDRSLGALLYERMRPWARRFTNNFSGSEGSYSRPLGQLAEFLGRIDEARQHFEVAIEDNRRAGAHPWVAHTQLAYGQMLLRTGVDADLRRARQLLDGARAIAGDLGMPGVVEQVERMVTNHLNTVTPSTALSTPGSFAGDLTDAFTLEGEYWTIRFEGKAYRFKDGKGLQILAHLVRHPGREFHVLQLTTVSDRTDVGEALVQGAVGAGPDAVARDAYRERAEDLREQLREAEAHDDLHRAARMRDELDLLAEEIARGVGLGGRERQAGGSAERARVNVQRRVADTLRKIEGACRPLGRHLARTIRTGSYCMYDGT